MVKNSGELNTYGYVLMATGQMQQAQVVFELNTSVYPTDPNVFDSMGEFYLKTGNKELAKRNYKKVLELEPENKNAKETIGKM